jgi:O-antigen ligase
VIIALVTAGLMISIAVIYQYSLLSEKTLQTLNQEINPVILEAINQKRISFPFRTPNSLGGYLILIIPLAMTFRYRLWIVFPLGVALLMTKSIGAMGSLFLVLFIYLYLQEKISRKEILLLSGALLAFSLIAFLRSFALPDHLQPFFSMKMRFTYWLETLRIIQSHPWMGVGIGDFDLPNSRHSHNMILQLWAEMGIFALLSFLTAIVAILRTGLTAFKNSPDKIKILGLICASFVFLVHNLIEFTFFLPEISVLWFMIMGLLSNTNDRLRPAKAPSS